MTIRRVEVAIPNLATQYELQDDGSWDRIGMARRNERCRVNLWPELASATKLVLLTAFCIEFEGTVQLWHFVRRLNSVLAIQTPE
jgi:hypothetical protein